MLKMHGPGIQQTLVIIQIGVWRPLGETTAERLVMIPINDTDDKNTRGIFPDIVKVVVVMVIIFKFNILLCIHVCVFKAYILANNRHFF